MTLTTKSAAAVVIIAMASCMAATAAELKNLGYVVDAASRVVISGVGACVRSGAWTPALAAAADAVKQCTPDLVSLPASAPSTAPAPQPSAKPQAKPEAKPEAKPVPVQTINYSADALFDFDKAVLKPDGKAKLDTLPSLLQGAHYDTIIAIGHTDRIGTSRYNQQLSVRRADAVKKYLVEIGVPASRIHAEGRGKTQPVTQPDTCRGKSGRALIACLQPDRRVVIEVNATK
jgi:OOP family OmpA-OmpF porin